MTTATTAPPITLNGTAPVDDLPPAAWLGAPEVERGVVAALLASSDVQDDYLAALTPNHFSKGLLRDVFTAIQSLRRDGRQADGDRRRLEYENGIEAPAPQPKQRRGRSADGRVPPVQSQA